MKNEACSFCELDTRGEGIQARNGRRICRTCLDACNKLPYEPVHLTLDLYPTWGDVDAEIKEIVLFALSSEVQVLRRNIERAEEFGFQVFERRMRTAESIYMSAISELSHWPAHDSWLDVTTDRRESVFAALIKSSYASRNESSQAEAHGLPEMAARCQKIERAKLSAAVALGWAGPPAPR